MAKHYTCSSCGAVSVKWAGRCEECGAWNAIVEEVAKHIKSSAQPTDILSSLSAISTEESQRILSHIEEFDRVCGGGLVPGSVILVGGDPGIGKSTLMLQMTAALSQHHLCVYVAGEEGLTQVKMRADRLRVRQDKFLITTCNNVIDLIAVFEKSQDLKVVVIDSVQTMAHPAIEAPIGSVSQVRAVAQALTESAKRAGYVVILIGHVTKEGVLAGPKVLEHMVDTVLYFDGEAYHDYRILRAIKNRFGATNEIGIFSMTDKGLEEVKNSSSCFLSNMSEDSVIGTAVTAGIEGTRPILCEIQALVTTSHLPAPRRVSIGWDNNRLSMLVAVLQSRCRLPLGNKDIYLNIAGGLKLREPAVDLAVASALISAVSDRANDPHSVYFGEISLAGKVRSVNHVELRLKEAAKLGFKTVHCHCDKKLSGIAIDVQNITKVGQLLASSK